MMDWRRLKDAYTAFFIDIVKSFSICKSGTYSYFWVSVGSFSRSGFGGVAHENLGVGIVDVCSVVKFSRSRLGTTVCDAFDG